MVQKLYGNKDKDWAKICLSADGSGDISEFLKNPEHIEEFKKPMGVLRAFSSNLTTLNHSVSDYEPPTLNKYAILSEAYTKYELPDHIEERNGGYTDALNAVNMFSVKKYGDRYALNKNNCKKSESIVVENLNDYHTKFDKTKS